MNWKAEWEMRSRKFPAIQMAIAYFVIGVFLWIQPDRWANTPSYANLLQLASTGVWGSIYLASALLMAAAVRFRARRIVLVVAHTVAIALTAAWFLAFVVRFATDDGTTIVNVVSWGVFLSRLIQSAVILDDDVVVLDLKERRDT